MYISNILPLVLELISIAKYFMIITFQNILYIHENNFRKPKKYNNVKM